MILHGGVHSLVNPCLLKQGLRIHAGV